MKKVILMTTLAVGAFFFSQAQSPEGFRFAIGPKINIPMGDLKDATKLGIGGEAQGEFDLTESVAGVFSAGYTHYLGKEVTVLGQTVKAPDFGQIPLLAGVRFYPVAGLFLGAKAGYSIFTGDGNTGGAFSYQPHIGINSSRLQLIAGYDGWSKDKVNAGALSVAALVKF